MNRYGPQRRKLSVIECLDRVMVLDLPCVLRFLFFWLVFFFLFIFLGRSLITYNTLQQFLCPFTKVKEKYRNNAYFTCTFMKLYETKFI